MDTGSDPLMDHDHASTDEPSPITSPLRDLSLRQSVGFGVAAAIVVVGLAWGVSSRIGGDFVPLPSVEPLTSTTARKLRATFRDAGLTGFRQSGDQIFVPTSQLDRYTALLPSASATTENWATEWERQNERLTPFSSNRAREATREIARAKLIAGMLRQLPDIEQADVVWDEDEQPGWRQSPKTRATVYLMPKPDRRLTLDVIRSVRLAVAGSKKNLDPSDVVVMDIAQQVTYEGALPATIGEDLIPALRSLAELYRREIRQHLPTLNEADVNVSVDLPRLLAFVAEHPQDAAAQLSAVAPTLLRVSVTTLSSAKSTSTERRRLQDKIVTLTGIGADAASRDERILIQFDHPQSLPNTVTTQSFAGLTLSSMGSHFVWGAAGVLVLAIAVVLLRRRSAKQQQHSSASRLPAMHAVNESAQSLRPTSALRPTPVITHFDDLASLDAVTLRTTYTHATPRRWAVALRGSSHETRTSLAAALEPLCAAELEQQCDRLGPVTIGDIESSRQRILESALSLHAPAS